MSSQMDRLVRVRPPKEVIQISHTCMAEDAAANPQRNQRNHRMLRSACQPDQTKDQTRTESADLKLRNYI